MFQTVVSPVPRVAASVVVERMVVGVVGFRVQGEDCVQGEEDRIDVGLDGEG